MDVNYELIPKAAVDALARRLAIGAQNHGRDNWRKGDASFVESRLNHLLKHLIDYIENGNKNDANSDAIICNAAFICHFEEKNPRQPK